MIAKIVFWFIFALAIMAAISALGVQALTDFVSRVVAYPPNVIAAMLGFALAFGLGGRDVARAILEDQYRSARAAMPQARSEAQLAKDRLADKAQDLRDQTSPPPSAGLGDVLS